MPSNTKSILQKKDVKKFQDLIYTHYATHGRHTLPWRTEATPYRTLVSEIMLQQTQVSRVIEKFNNFMDCFPAITDLASAPQSQVLELWQGLGYNRRALFLHRCAQEVTDNYNGIIPENIDTLCTLPGIGPATAAAVSTYAYNKPNVYIETNIRAVFIHHYFPSQEKVHDKELYPLIEETLDTENPAKWYSAIMDYGTWLKKVMKNPSRKSRHHTKQSKFEGSDRQIRGRIIKLLLEKSTLSITQFCSLINENEKRIEPIIEDLISENFLLKTGSKYQLI